MCEIFYKSLPVYDHDFYIRIIHLPEYKFFILSHYKMISSDIK